MKNILLITFSLLLILKGNAQKHLSLDEILAIIQVNHPAMKMYDADIHSMDEAAKGAKSWMVPEFAAGFYQTPYNVNRWKAMDGQSGMGMFMVSGQQTFPNKKKQETQLKYMEAMSSVEKERKNATLNELFADAKQSYIEGIIIKKKLAVVTYNEKVLGFMIKNAEIRYKNGLEKLSAYFKAKAALGNLTNMELMLENDWQQNQIKLNTLMNTDKFIEFSIDTNYTINEYPKESLDSTHRK